jgi:hypothetical protein
MFFRAPADQTLLSQYTGDNKNMKNRLILTTVLSAVAFMGVANAFPSGEVGSGTLGVGADIQGALSVTFTTHSGGLTVTGSGSNAASLAFGTFSSFSPNGTTGGVTKTTGSGTFSLAATVDIQVDVANSSSEAYTLAATLATPVTANTWLIGATDVSDGASHDLAGDQPYGTAVPYVVKLTVANSATAGSIANSISFVATGQ